MSLPYMPLYIADYMADAGHLPTLAHGAYMLLLFNYWQRQGPLPDDDFTLQGVTKLGDSDWEKLKPHLARFFQSRDGFWHHKRVDEELERANEKIEQARNKGRRSAEQRLNRSSTAVEQQFGIGSTTKVKGKGNTTTLISDEISGSGSASATTTTELDEKEIERRCVQATNWKFTRGFGSIVDLVRSGVDLDSRILPILRTLADDPKINSWAYAATAISDPRREAAPSAREVELVWVKPESPEWQAMLDAGKKLSFLKSQLKPLPGGGEAMPIARTALPSRATA